jgi:hypothetical protein
MNVKNFTVAVAMIIGFAAPAVAAVVNANIVYDLSAKVNNTTNSWILNGLDPLVSQVSINTGDTVHEIISFLPGQALQWNGGGTINGWLGSTNVGTFFATQTTMNFTGLTSGPDWTNAIADTSSCCAHTGPTSTIIGDGLAREFTGIDISYVVTYLTPGTKTFTGIGFIELFSRGTVHRVAAPLNVPEPGTVAMFGLGMLALLVTRRKSMKHKNA